MSLAFGSFSSLCYQIAMPLCPLVEKKQEPVCYSRNIEIGGLLIFEPGKFKIGFQVSLFILDFNITYIQYHVVGKL